MATTKLRPTTVALMLATKLQERYTGPNAPELPSHMAGEVIVNALPVPGDVPPEGSVNYVHGLPPGATETAPIQNPRYYDPEFEQLVHLLTDMDARTGKPDPSKRRKTPTSNRRR